MARSLKERYETRRIQLVQERVAGIDKQLLVEQHAAQLIVEAMSQEDLNKVSTIVKKLDSIKTPELPKLTAAIEQAQAELNKYTAGGPISAAWTKMKQLVGIDNPIVKVTTFADALEKGFSQIPTILRNNGINLQNADLSKSLTTLLGAQAPGGTKTGEKSDKSLGDTSFGGKSAFTDDPIGSEMPSQNEADAPQGTAGNKLKAIVAQLQKALSPGGIFGAFKKVPYISSQELAQELVGVPLRAFANVAKKINAGAKAAEIAPDLKATITGQGQAQTKGVDKEDPTKKAGQSQPTTPPKPATVTSKTVPTGETTPKPQGGGAPAPAVNHEKVKSTIEKLMKSNSAAAFIKILMDAGLDPHKLGGGNSTAAASSTEAN
jgi:hypothetical protein